MGIRQQPIKTTATTESKAIKAFQVLHTLPRVSVPDTMQGVTKVWMDGEAAKIDGEIEASPAVYNNMLVIGTTGKGTSYIYGIRIQ